VPGEQSQSPFLNVTPSAGGQLEHQYGIVIMRVPA